MSSDDRFVIRLPPPPEPTERRPHALTIWLSGIALVVAVLSACFSAWQANEAHKARIADIAAFKFDQRPILSVSGYKAVKSADGQHIDFTLTLKSDGKTPPYGVKRDLQAFYDHTLIVTAQPEQSDTSFGLGAETQLHYTIPVALTPEQAKTVGAGTAALKLILKVNFRNAFNEAEPQTGWCLQYDPVQLDHFTPCSVE
jgi:hypothetical protein